MVPWNQSGPNKVLSMSKASVPDNAPSSSQTFPSNVSSSAQVNPLTLNGPGTEPVLFQPEQQQKVSYHDDADPRCRSCHSTEIVTDWKQGDRICTNCGVVLEEHIMDDRPEWRDFNDAEDIIKGQASGARSGLVLVDESKYLGGLQPTRLSKHAFGGDNSLLAMGKRLKTTNKRMDQLMEKRHHKALKEAKLDRAIRRKRGTNENNDYDAYNIFFNDNCDANSDIRPEMDQLILQEEEDAHRMQAALYSEKWSLDRAILLNGSSDISEQAEGISNDALQEEREDLIGRMDRTLKKASEDMYTAYKMLTEGAQKLHLPNQVQNEVVHRLVRFVTRRDGFFVRGVSSRLSKNHDPKERKKAAEQLREYNKLKQMGALAAAILFLTARGLGWARSITEVCASIEPPASSILQFQKVQPFVKPKHCSRAMQEIKTSFPEYGGTAASAAAVVPVTSSSSKHANTAAGKVAASPGDDAMATSNFADHALRRLQLPPVAEACARTLLLYSRGQQIHLGRNSGTKLSTLCAAITFFVCSAGTIMQRLAQQTAQQQLETNNSKKAPRSAIVSSSSLLKRNHTSSRKTPPRKKLKTVDDGKNKKGKVNTINMDNDDDSDDDDLLGWKTPSKTKDGDDDDVEPFDVFSHAPIVEDRTEKHQYEMRRMWDAWAEQMPWARSISEVEQSCGVSRSVILDFYKTKLYPQREELLKVLSDAVDKTKQSKSMLLDTPLAPILLVHISTAAPLMIGK